MLDQTSITPQSTPHRTLTTKDAARFIGVQESTLEQWRWNGRGPRFCKLGRSCRYRIEDLEAFLEERCFKSTTEAQANKAA